MSTIAPLAAQAPKAEAVTKSTGINKTNIEYAKHHFDQAIKSLERGTERLDDMTGNKTGSIAQGIRDNVYFPATDMQDKIDTLIDELDSYLKQVQELLS